MTAAVQESPAPCRLVICDDQPQLRSAMRDVLSPDPRFEVVGEAQDAETCLEQLRTHRPDVLILDVNMPGGGPGLARSVRHLAPDTYVLVFSAHRDPGMQSEMLASGADAYVVKTGRLAPLLAGLAVACVC